MLENMARIPVSVAIATAGSDVAASATPACRCCCFSQVPLSILLPCIRLY